MALLLVQTPFYRGIETASRRSVFLQDELTSEGKHLKTGIAQCLDGSVLV